MTQLKTARKRAGLTQAQLAEKSGVDQTTISKLELGAISDPSHFKVQRICRVLGIQWSSIAEFRLPGNGPKS